MFICLVVNLFVTNYLLFYLFIADSMIYNPIPQHYYNGKTLKTPKTILVYFLLQNMLQFGTAFLRRCSQTIQLSKLKMVIILIR